MGVMAAAFEFMELRYPPEGPLVFIAHPSGQGMTTFEAVRVDDSEAMFGNLLHDFPQRVIYVREGESRIDARIEGVQDGARQALDFPMTRVACPGPADGSP